MDFEAYRVGWHLITLSLSGHHVFSIEHADYANFFPCRLPYCLLEYGQLSFNSLDCLLYLILIV